MSPTVLLRIASHLAFALLLLLFELFCLLTRVVHLRDNAYPLSLDDSHGGLLQSNPSSEKFVEFGFHKLFRDSFTFL